MHPTRLRGDRSERRIVLVGPSALFAIALVAAGGGFRVWAEAPPAAAEQIFPSLLVSGDPATPGPYAVEVAEYQGGPTVVVDPKGIAYPAEIHGVLHYPATGKGPFPLLILLHGNHGTCAVLGAEATGYPCPQTPVTGPVPNYRGYDYLGDSLASHGYVTASIDANAVNTYNVAGDKGAHERAQLIARTLDHLSGLDAGTAVDLAEVGDDLRGRIDFARIGMMGHSRGGEAVSYFIGYNETRDDGPRYHISAVLSLAGTDYNLPRASGVHFGTLLPLCDGDVYDLQSVFAWDRHRFDAEATPFARVQFTVAGTNHNFYNTTWTGDDFSTSPTAGRCSSGAAVNDRLSAADTRRVGLVLVSGFLRRYVGGELAFQPLMTGAAPLPSSACPRGVGPCPGLVGTSYLAPKADRRLLAPRLDGDPVRSTTEGATISAQGFSAVGSCDPKPDGGMDGKSRDAGTASGCASNPYRSRARALTLQWSAAGARLAVSLGNQRDVRGFDALTFRAATNFGAPTTPGPSPAGLEVALFDTAGRIGVAPVSAYSSALVPMAPDAARKLTMNGVSIPLVDFAVQGVDLAKIDRVELRAATAKGSVQITELGFQRLTRH
ncbi:MAG: hypothetical protein QOD06_1459 [Candidatus Binatota bacterium]|nr:hypothetical protein [Candidatus Binatota bacterium]